MSTIESLVQRKAALRAEQRRRRRLLAPAAGAAADAAADRLTAAFRLPEGAVVSGYRPLADELDPRPAMSRLAAAGHAPALPRVQVPAGAHDQLLDAVITERAAHRCSAPDGAAPAAALRAARG